jgi:heparan-alpha-glucosaminide N-acetyltransferase
MDTAVEEEPTLEAMAAALRQPTPEPEPMPMVPKPVRVASLDAYRGFVMLLMMAGLTLGLAAVAHAIPGNPYWAFLGHHQTHVEWTGASLHDLIQPSFSFIVGVALPFSIMARMARGQSRGKLALHAFFRAFLLIVIGTFLASVNKPMTVFRFGDTLCQIGLGYGFLFLLGFRPVRDQWIVFALLVIGYWLAFALYPLPGPDFDYAKVGVPPDWFAQHGLKGFAAHWNKNSNFAWHFDTWFRNLFPPDPKDGPYKFNDGGYTTLNFIPTLATMILGLITGEVLRGERTPLQKVRWMMVAGVLALAVGWGLGEAGICPVVKRIWTPSFVLYSGGWCLLLIAAFYLVMDVWKIRFWAFPLVVIGLNSIAAYCMVHLMDGFIRTALLTHVGTKNFEYFGKEYKTLVLGGATLLVLWVILFWMHRRKIFLRI